MKWKKPEENLNQSLEGEICLLCDTRKAGMAGPEPLRVNKSMLLARRDWSMSPKVSRDTSIKMPLSSTITLDPFVRWNTQVLEHLIWTQ